MARLPYVSMTLKNPAHPAKSARIRFFVDSGTPISVAPGQVLTKIGLRPSGTQKFDLVDGSEIERPVGQAVFVYRGQERVSPIIFGEEGDSTVLGKATLASFGLALNPLRGELVKLPA